MPTKRDPGTLEIGNGKAAQDSVTVSSLDFAAVIDLQSALNAHIHDPLGAHLASAISVVDLGDNYTATNVENSLIEISDVLPDQPNVLGVVTSGVPNTGVPDWNKLDDADTNVNGTAETAAFTCNTINHVHVSWGGSGQGGTPGDWVAESHCIIPGTTTNFTLQGTIYPADRGVLVLLYSSTGNFNNAIEVELAKLNLTAIFTESRRRDPAVGYQQLNYTATGTGTDKISLTYRLPALKQYAGGVPYTPYTFNYLDFQLARFSIPAITISGYADDMGSFRLYHFKTYTNVATANYSAANLYGQSHKDDVFRDTDPSTPSITATNYTVLPSYPLGTETTGSAQACSIIAPNDLTVSTASFADPGDLGKSINITGSSNGNNGVVQILKVFTSIRVLVTPNFGGTDESSGAFATILGVVVNQFSGVKHYGQANGFQVNAATPGLWTYSYLTGKAAVTNEVSAAYLNDDTPYTAGLDDFGLTDRDVPYYDLDNNGSAGPWNLTKGNGPLSGDSVIYKDILSTGSLDAGSGAAKVENIIRTPFASAILARGTGEIPEKFILTNTATQTVSGRYAVEDFKTERFFRYPVAQEFALGTKYPMQPYTPTGGSGSDGVAIGGQPNQFSSVSAGFSGAMVGNIIIIGNSSNGNNGSYMIQSYVSGNTVTLTPNWPGTVSETSLTWEMPAQWNSATSLGSGEAQLLGGKLVYPKIDHSTLAYPTASQPNYATLFSGDGAGTIRYFVRLMDTGSAKNMGKLRVVGIAPAAMLAGTWGADIPTEHIGGVVINVKVPGQSGWLDLGRYDGYPNGDKTNDRYGCLISYVQNGVDDYTYTFYTGYLTTYNGEGRYPLAIRIGLIKGTGDNKTISLVEWQSY